MFGLFPIRVRLGIVGLPFSPLLDFLFNGATSQCPPIRSILAEIVRTDPIVQALTGILFFLHRLLQSPQFGRATHFSNFHSDAGAVRYRGVPVSGIPHRNIELFVFHCVAAAQTIPTA
uniref:Putative secreted protein n=1 Tax=Anopheles darlingi TaxID=43151 RepID=A0A2M4DPZ2_ANODA